METAPAAGGGKGDAAGRSGALSPIAGDGRKGRRPVSEHEVAGDEVDEALHLDLEIGGEVGVDILARRVRDLRPREATTAARSATPPLP